MSISVLAKSLQTKEEIASFCDLKVKFVESFEKWFENAFVTNPETKCKFSTVQIVQSGERFQQIRLEILQLGIGANRISMDRLTIFHVQGSIHRGSQTAELIGIGVR